MATNNTTINKDPKNLTWDGLLKILPRIHPTAVMDQIIVYVKETDKYLHVKSVDFNDKKQLILVVDSKELDKNGQTVTAKTV